MSDVNTDPLPPEEPILEKVARTQGEPSLFPPEVLRLHREGRAIKARRELLRAANGERNAALAAKQRAYAEDLHLWQEQVGGAPSMYTLNGIGTRLYGKAQPTADGTYIATLWFTFVFVPIWPLKAYLVLPAPTGGWHFLSRTPLPPVATGARRGVGAVAIMLALSLAYSAYWSGTHAVVHAFNGFDEAVHVTVGETSQVLLPRQAAVFGDVPAARAQFSASWGANEEPFESIDVDLSGRATGTVVYNVGGRAVLRYEWITYGEGIPPEGRLLDAGPVLFEDDVDYPFTEPPDSMSVRDGGTVERSLLYALDDGLTAESVAGQLLEIGRTDQARTVASAELEAHPEDGRLVFFLAMTEHADDRDAQVALFRRYMERAPDAVELHRYYQELWPEGSAELREEYAGLLGANPDSPMYHYLVGRIANPGSADALAHFSEATRLAPDYPPAVRALGYHAMSVGDWSTALEQFDRYAAAGPVETYEIFDARARVASRLGRPWEEIDAILANTLAARPDALHIGQTRAHRLVQTGDVGVTDAANAINDEFERMFGPADRDVRIANLRADLAITTGDLPRARSELDGLEDPSNISVTVAQRLALSVGATLADRERLASIPDWPFSSDPMEEFLALQLVDGDERLELLERMDPSVAEIVSFFDSDDITSPDRLAELTVDFAPSMRMWVHFAAGRTLAGNEQAERAREAYFDEAYSFALPGDLPYRR